MKKTNKIISLLLVLSLLVCACPFAAAQDTSAEEDDCIGFHAPTIRKMIEVNLECGNADEEFFHLLANAYLADPELLIETIMDLPDDDIAYLAKAIAYDLQKTNRQADVQTDFAEPATEVVGRLIALETADTENASLDSFLDEDLLMQTTNRLKEAGLSVQCFIPGDTLLRGPLHEGLPTLELHRHVLPSAAFVDMALRFGMDDIFLGDPGLSQKEQERIATFCRDGVICVPAKLDDAWRHLYGKVFTCRIDSPKWLIRFQESRIYSCQGDIVEPSNCTVRRRGVITVDNKNYGRYSGELMLMREDLPADERVNVIGQVPENALLLVDRIDRGAKFMLVEE